jgi:tRNA(fMet)-specific endonuclease VapC
VIHILDTTTFSALMRHDRRTRERMAALEPTDELCLSAITRGEILYGLEALPYGQRRAALTFEADRLFAVIPCVPVAEHVAALYARLKWQLRQAGVALSDNDIWIAATARALNATVVSADRDFQRVVGLPVADWTA